MRRSPRLREAEKYRPFLDHRLKRIRGWAIEAVGRAERSAKIGRERHITSRRTSRHRLTSRRPLRCQRANAEPHHCRCRHRGAGRASAARLLHHDVRDATGGLLQGALRLDVGNDVIRRRRTGEGPRAGVGSRCNSRPRRDHGQERGGCFVGRGRVIGTLRPDRHDSAAHLILPPCANASESTDTLMEELMRHLSIVSLMVLVVLGAAPVSLLAEESAHSCAKAEKSCCKEKADCCKDNADCCKADKACCDDANCCTTAADGTHTCAMKHADGTACSHSCCKDKSCSTTKTS